MSFFSVNFTNFVISRYDSFTFLLSFVLSVSIIVCCVLRSNFRDLSSTFLLLLFVSILSVYGRSLIIRGLLGCRKSSAFHFDNLNTLELFSCLCCQWSHVEKNLTRTYWTYVIIHWCVFYHVNYSPLKNTQGFYMKWSVLYICF